MTDKEKETPKEVNLAQEIIQLRAEMSVSLELQAEILSKLQNKPDSKEMQDWVKNRVAQYTKWIYQALKDKP